MRAVPTLQQHQRASSLLSVLMKMKMLCRWMWWEVILLTRRAETMSLISQIYPSMKSLHLAMTISLLKKDPTSQIYQSTMIPTSQIQVPRWNNHWTRHPYLLMEIVESCSLQLITPWGTLQWLIKHSQWFRSCSFNPDNLQTMYLRPQKLCRAWRSKQRLVWRLLRLLV